MASGSNSVSGYWTGYLVHDRIAAQVNVHITDKNGSLSGWFDVPASGNKKKPRGEFTGRRFIHTLYIKVSQYGRHRELEFHVTMVNEKQGKMIHGMVPLPGVTMPFATVSLFPSRSPASTLAGAWPFIDTFGIVPKA